MCSSVPSLAKQIGSDMTSETGHQWNPIPDGTGKRYILVI